MKTLAIVLVLIGIMAAGCVTTEVADTFQRWVTPDNVKRAENLLQAWLEREGGIEAAYSNAMAEITETVSAVPVSREWTQSAIGWRYGARIPDGRLMNILSHAWTEDQFHEQVSWMQDRGADTAYVFVSNVADGPPISYYVNGLVFGEVDESRVRMMTERLQTIRKHGMVPILWLFADDSSAISRLPANVLADFATDIVQRWDALAGGYVVALEANEHMDRGKVAAVAQRLQGATDKPIGLHMTSDKFDWSRDIPEIDVHYHQVNRGKSAAQIEAETRKVVAGVGKPVVMCEVAFDPSPELAKAARNGGAIGVGCGR